MFFVQTSTTFPTIHRKLTEHGRYCTKYNQLPTKSRVELEEKSNTHYALSLAEVLQHHHFFLGIGILIVHGSLWTSVEI
jgi:hypothetical protein